MDWRAREAELLRRNEALDREKSQVAMRAASMLREAERKFTANRYDVMDDEDDDAGYADYAEVPANADKEPEDEQPAPPSRGSRPQSGRYGSSRKATGSRKKGKMAGTSAQASKKDAKKSRSARTGSRSRPTSSRYATTGEGGDASPSGPPSRGRTVGGDTGGLSAHATVRLQKARLIALEKALSKLSKENIDNTAALKTTKQKLEDAEEKNRALKRSLQKAEQSAAKTKKSMYDGQQKSNSMQREMQVMKQKLSGAVKEKNQLQAASRNLDLKLNRALAEIDKLKGRVKNQRTQVKSSGDASRKDYLKLQDEHRRVLQHNKELVVAFKKQMKLIDVLKRQKLHMEAAKMLSFTEGEFAKSINFK